MKHSITAIAVAFAPFFLLPTASAYTHAVREAERMEERTLASEMQERTHLLAGELRAVEHAYALINADAEGASLPSSILPEEPVDAATPLLTYITFRERMAQIEESVQALRARLAGIGRKVIHVDLSQQMATLIERGRVVAEYRVSSGAQDTPTPQGTFEIHGKQTLRVSSRDVPYRMPYYMAFTPSQSHGFHALPYLGKSPESSDYWQEARSHIGIPVSHGCIRLLPEDAAKVYEWVEVGTKVYIRT